MKNFGSEHQVIWLRTLAPSKPAYGDSCNGCGVCCAAQTCPVARVFLGQWRGQCRALEWHAASLQYRCGMLLQPMHYLPFIPQFLEPQAARYLSGIVIPMVRRWIAADTNCDSTAEL